MGSNKFTVSVILKSGKIVDMEESRSTRHEVLKWVYDRFDPSEIDMIEVFFVTDEGLEDDSRILEN